MEVFSYDCKTIQKEMDYDSSDYVFLGEIIEVGKGYYVVKTHEFFKGVQTDTLRGITDNISIFPKLGEVWLFYAKNYSEKEIYVNRCGWSRSFSRPFSFSSDNFPKPPPKDASKSLLEFLDAFNKKAALDELRYDILSLRERKMLKELDNIKSNYKVLQENNTKLNKQVVIFKWTIFILILLVIAGVLILYKKIS